jgi:hypothetical protein
VRIAIDIDSTLHHHWPLVAAAAKRRFGVDLPYEQQFPWAGRRLGEELYCGRDKVARCRRIGIDLLIDDSPENLHRALDAGILAATLRHPWNVEVCDTPQVISAADWRELARVLQPVLDARPGGS